MNNDLISRKWLRTAIIKMFGDSDIASSIDAIIDNAPAVEVYTKTEYFKTKNTIDFKIEKGGAENDI